MLRMRLIFVFRVLVRENNVQRDLITLLHDGAIALHHFAGAKFNNARNVLEKLICRREQFIGRDKIVRVGPEDNDVGKHDLYLSCKNSAHAPSGGKRKQRVMRGACSVNSDHFLHLTHHAPRTTSKILSFLCGANSCLVCAAYE
jgi:hypothetical protein